MGLYRQIAGPGNPGGLGTLSWNLSSWFPEMTPVDYSSPPEYVPNTLEVSDTGGTSPFADPRDYNPDTISLDTTPLPGPETSPLPTINPSQPIAPTTSVIPADINTAIKNNILPLLALAGVLVVAIKGDDLLHEKRKIALLGGLGLLYYGMAKNKTA
jgi:hypothetical protein